MQKATHLIVLAIALISLMPKAHCDEAETFLSRKRELSGEGGHCCFYCNQDSDCCPGLFCGHKMGKSRRCLPIALNTWNFCDCPEADEECLSFDCERHILLGKIICP